jgi:hypothetical protein
MVVWLASLVVAGAVFSSLGGVAHGAGRPCEQTAALAGGWAIVSAAATLVLRRRRSVLGPPWVVLGLVVGVVPLALVVWTTAFQGTYREPFERVGWRCLGATLVIALFPLVGTLLARRGVEPRHPAELGAAVGTVCGAWATVILQVWCPLVNTLHVLVGHLLPVLLVMGAGGVLGARLLPR